MMKPKKPLFWIVIAAVALCIVVAVCLLVNPKDYGPEVGNPQMLELPGVEWFATPDEVKEALNISEEQIVWENKSSGYILTMGAKDFILFGREVVFAEFDFWFNNNGDTALRKVTVYFSEDTDMIKLKKELIEIYGPGKDEPYRFSVKGLLPTTQKLSDMEVSAESEDGWDNVEGNPFRDALEDPDYMAHHWIIENSTLTVPEEVAQYWKSVEDEDIPQTDDAFMENLDQRPWVVISMANRNAWAIINKITGAKDELYPGRTNNYMIFNAEVLSEYLYSPRGNG